MDDYIIRKNEEAYDLNSQIGEEKIPLLYKSERIKKQDEEKSKEKFDLCAAIRDGCSIDESGICTCGVGA